MSKGVLFGKGVMLPKPSKQIGNIAQILLKLIDFINLL